MDKNDIIEYVMNTPHNTNKAVLSSMLNQLAEGGGGGSSDFSTAQVTFINADTAHSYSVAAFRIDSDCMSDLDIAVSEPVTIEVPLYKGKAEMGFFMLMNADFSYTPTATGGVSIVTDANMSDKFVITGDGTITAKGHSLE